MSCFIPFSCVHTYEGLQFDDPIFVHGVGISSFEAVIDRHGTELAAEAQQDLKSQNPDLISIAAKAVFGGPAGRPGKGMASRTVNHDATVHASTGVSGRSFRHRSFERCLAELLFDQPCLNNSKRREMLAFWASDANAVDGRPSLRRIPGRDMVVPIDAILHALKQLDEAGGNFGTSPSLAKNSPPGRHQR